MPTDPLPTDEVPRLTPNQLLIQVLTAINDIRDQFKDFRDEQHDMRARMAEMATKDDLKQFITRDLADARETATSERLNAMTTRQQRTEDRVEGLRDEWNKRTIAEAKDETAWRIDAAEHAGEQRQTFLFRGNDRLWAILLLLVSPILYALFTALIYHKP